MHVDGVIARIARSHHGLIATTHAAAAGVDRRSLWRRSRTGQLEHVRRGVWRIAGAPRTWEQQALAAVLAGGADTVLSHAAAARLWGFDGFERSAVEVCEARHRSSDLTGIRTHHTVVFDPDRSMHRGIPVTTPARTLIDLAGRMPTAALGRLVDGAIRRGLLTIDDLARCAERLRPAPGRPMRRVRAVLAVRLGGFGVGESVLEERIGRLLSEKAQLEGLVRQFPVQVGGRRFRIDIAQPELRIAHEVDGWHYHNSRSSFSDDRERANRLTAAGWTVLRYTADMSDAEIIAVAQATQARAQSAQRPAS
jgi:very-short-patch-repair endonuclease